jgi:lipopolysaccharide transport system permease protein
MMRETAAVLHYTRIVPTRGWVPLRWKELWDYRELLFFLALRDVKVRYKQTLLGSAWAVLVPLSTMLVFNVLFGLLMGAHGKPTVEGVPYALSTLAALVPWQLFANAMGQSGNSLVANRNMITKVYFPRLIAPLAPIFSSLLDFAIAFGVLLLMIAGYQAFGDFTFVPSWRLLSLPLLVLLTVVNALALSLWLSALNAIYRDIRYVIPFLVQILMFVSPVVYTSASILHPDTPAWLATAYWLNPLAGVLEGFRWALFGSPVPSLAPVLATSFGGFVLLAGGAYYFRRMERLFADLS